MANIYILLFCQCIALVFGSDNVGNTLNQIPGQVSLICEDYIGGDGQGDPGRTVVYAEFTKFSTGSAIVLDVDPDTLTTEQISDGVKVTGTMISPADATFPLPYRSNANGESTSVMSITRIENMNGNETVDTSGVLGSTNNSTSNTATGGHTTWKQKPHHPHHHMHGADRARRQLDEGGREVLIMCVTMSNGNNLVSPSYCEESAIRSLFSNESNGENVDAYYRAATWDAISFPSEKVDFVNVTVESLITTTTDCNVGDVSRRTDAVATGLQLTLEQSGAQCLDTATGAVDGNGHGYGTPEQCALRCMCDIDNDSPSGRRIFSIDNADEFGLYRCLCSAYSNSSCVSGYKSDSRYNTYSFSLDNNAPISQARFCSAGHHRVYAMPFEYGDCEFAAAAFICGDDTKGACQTYLRGLYGYATIHELGHNLGLHHASADWSNDGNAHHDSEEYADPSDVMGSGWFPFANKFNAPHLVQLGVLPQNRILDLDTSTCTQTVTLVPLSTDPYAPQAGWHTITIPRSAAIGGGIYYIAFRTATGFDTGMSLETANRISVTYMTDATSRTRLVSTVLPGVPFQDSLSRLQISTDMIACNGSTSTQVSIDLCWDGEILPSTAVPNAQFELVVGANSLCNLGFFPFPILAENVSAAECAAQCAGTCGCQYFNFNSSTGRCMQAETTSDCCRGELSFFDGTGGGFYKLSNPTTAFPNICGNLAVTGVSEVAGRYSIDPTSTSCNRSYIDNTGSRFLFWSDSESAWCFSASVVSTCQVKLPAVVDDPTKAETPLHYSGVVIEGSRVQCTELPACCQRRGNRPR